MLAMPLRPSHRDPGADARQVFQGDAPSRVLGLQSLTKWRAALAEAIHLAARVDLAIRVGGPVNDPQIPSQPIIGLKGGGLGTSTTRQVELI